MEVRKSILLPVLVCGVALTGGLVFVARPAYAGPPQQPDSRAEIISPGTSAILSGVVPITGTAVDPDFRQYELEFAPDPPIGGVWFAIQPPIAQQVREGVLGAWDTTFVEDGRYLIRLRVVRNDDSENIDQVRVFVANATATPSLTPTATRTLTPTFDLGATVSGPTKTPLIQQPPTRTLRPFDTPDGPSPTPRTIDLTGGPFQSDRLRQAALSGVRIALGAFVVLGLYGLARTVLRNQLRTAWWWVRRRIIDPLVGGGRRKRG
jgi:hypothetical protein